MTTLPGSFLVAIWGGEKTVGTSTKVIFSFMWPLVTALGSWTCTYKGVCWCELEQAELKEPVA